MEKGFNDFYQELYYYHVGTFKPDQKETLPKAQRTRGLSSSYQSNLMGRIKFKHKS